jgi:hypothetical protein
MKISAVLAILSLTTAFGSAYAAETDGDNVNAYCEEQAQLAGIEDSVEKQEYMKECVESYATQEDGDKPAGE